MGVLQLVFARFFSLSRGMFSNVGIAIINLPFGMVKNKLFMVVLGGGLLLLYLH